MMPEGIVIIVGSDPDWVERELAAGVVPCPRCGGSLARWGSPGVGS